jgi:hypothetical protein
VGVVRGIFWAAWREWTVLGLLARDRARSSNSAEKFERYVIFLGFTDNSDISDFSLKFRQIFFPCSEDVSPSHIYQLDRPGPSPVAVVDAMERVRLPLCIV